MTLYEVLGIAVTAGADEIRAAYRRLAKETHPDSGGDREKFQQVQHAWEVLGNAEKRRRYDATGDEGESGGVPTAAQMLASAFDAALDEVGGADPLTYVKLLLQERLKVERKALVNHEREVGRWQKIRGRLQRKCGEAILEGVIEGKMRPHHHGAAQARAWIERLEVSLNLAAGYDYQDGTVEETSGDLLEGLQGQRVHQRKRRAMA